MCFVTSDQASLLFLLPPSCIVVPIGNIVNKFLFSSLSPSTTSNSTASALPTMSSSNHMEIDSSKGQTPANDLKVRGRTSSSATNISREPSMTSSGWSTPYYDRMDNQMDCNSEPGDKTPGLSYETEQEKTFYFNKVLETTGNTRPQEGSDEATHLNPQRILNKNQNIWPLMSRVHKVTAMMSSTSSSHTTLMLLLNWTYGVVTSILFPFMVLLNKLLLTSRVSKTL